MTKLEKLHKEIQKENRRIEMMKNIYSNSDCIDTQDFATTEIKNAKALINKLQLEFDKEYEIQN